MSDCVTPFLDTCAEYRGPDADAKAAAIQATLGTDVECLTDVFWLLRYTTVKYDIRWPTFAEFMEPPGDKML